jgi:hypothetical protein
MSVMNFATVCCAGGELGLDRTQYLGVRRNAPLGQVYVGSSLVVRKTS